MATLLYGLACALWQWVEQLLPTSKGQNHAVVEGEPVEAVIVCIQDVEEDTTHKAEVPDTSAGTMTVADACTQCQAEHTPDRPSVHDLSWMPSACFRWTPRQVTAEHIQLETDASLGRIPGIGIISPTCKLWGYIPLHADAFGSTPGRGDCSLAEALAVFMGVMAVLSTHRPKRISVQTDNRGITTIFTRLIRGEVVRNYSHPQQQTLAALANMARRNGVGVRLKWVPRKRNRRADRLSRGKLPECVDCTWERVPLHHFIPEWTAR